MVEGNDGAKKKAAQETAVMDPVGQFLSDLRELRDDIELEQELVEAEAAIRKALGGGESSSDTTQPGE